LSIQSCSSGGDSSISTNVFFSPTPRPNFSNPRGYQIFIYAFKTHHPTVVARLDQEMILEKSTIELIKKRKNMTP
jgi:hypothetical protein